MAPHASLEELKLRLLSEVRCYGGLQRIYDHWSKATNCRMKFSIFLPYTETEKDKKYLALFFLSGICCNQENFLLRTGFQKYAKEHDVVIVGPDTSPRGCDLPGERETILFGRSAGWFLDATEEPYSSHYNMYTYICNELREIVLSHFPVHSQMGIMGHSMGGHGAITIGLRNPSLFPSISSLAPSCHPTSWGNKVIFEKFLGPDEDKWKSYDAVLVAKTYQGPPRRIFIDQGCEDEYLNYLCPQRFVDIVEENPHHLSVVMRWQEGYDHSYYFVASFINDHILYHKENLSSMHKIEDQH